MFKKFFRLTPCNRLTEGTYKFFDAELEKSSCYTQPSNPQMSQNFLKKVESNKSQSMSIDKKPILGMKTMPGFSKHSHDSVSFRPSMGFRGDSLTKIDEGYEGHFEMQQSKRSILRRQFSSVDEIPNPCPDSPSHAEELEDDMPSEFSTLPGSQVPKRRSIIFISNKI